MNEKWMKDLIEVLTQGAIGFSPIDEPKGGINLPIEDEECLVEIHPDRSLVCLFGLDLDDLRGMISGDATEDLSSDELQRVAKDSLRQTIGFRGRVLRQQGFQEEVQAAEGYFVMCYRKILTDEVVQNNLGSIRECLKIIGKKNGS